MGAKTWMLVYAKGNHEEVLKSNPVLDQAATCEFTKKLFSSEKITLSRVGDLPFTCPAEDELVVAASLDSQLLQPRSLV